MASSSSAVNDSVILTEDDIPGASLAGRNPSSLKNEELRFWLRFREDSLKGLKTKALLVKRYAQCIDFNSSLTVGKFSGKNAFIRLCRNESAYYEFREKSREHPTSFYSNKFKKGENFFDRPIFKRYRGN